MLTRTSILAAVCAAAFVLAPSIFTGCRVTGSSSDDDRHKNWGAGVDGVIQISFDPQGGIWQDGPAAGTDVPIIVEQVIGETLKLPDAGDPTLANSILRGWTYQQKEKMSELDTNFPPDEEWASTGIVVGDNTPTTIYALWQEYDVNNFDVSFYKFADKSDINDSSSPVVKQSLLTFKVAKSSNSYKVTDPMSQDEKEAVVREHYDVVEASANNIRWYKFNETTHAIESTPFDFSTTITANIVLVLKWTPKTYTITFELNGGRFASNADDDVVTVPVQYPNKPSITAPAHTAFVFYHWNTQSNNAGTSKSTTQINDATPTADTTYYAIWTLPEDGLTYDVSGSTTPWLGDHATLILPLAGDYKIELWGAQGGYAGTATGGYGAYTAGEINLPANTMIYFYIGGTRVEGMANSNAAAYNGAGSGMTNTQNGTGGGATDVRLVPASTALADPSLDSASLNSRIMVAAGGGGANATGGDGVAHNGAAAGGYTGLRGVSSGTITNDPATSTTGNANYQPWGGEQTQGGFGRRTVNGGNQGTFGIGGSVTPSRDSAGESAGGGGGGWFGGGAGNHDSKNSSGAGGSSYISGHAGCVGGTFAPAENWPISNKSGADYYARQNDGTFTPSSGDAGSVARSKSPSGKYFTATALIDGLGSANTWSSGAAQLVQTAMPTPTGGTYPAGQGRPGAGSARIRYLDQP